MAVDEIIIPDKTPKIRGDRFSVIGGELAINDEYLSYCGCCILSKDCIIENFLEKRDKSEILFKFKRNEFIPVSWGGYYIPPRYEKFFISLFADCYKGEFSRMIEAGYQKDERHWLESNPLYSKKFIKLSKRWKEINREFRFINFGRTSYFKHLGSNEEYFNFCQSIFYDKILQIFLEMSMANKKNKLISKDSIVGKKVSMGEKIIICNNSVVKNGIIEDGCVISNSIIDVAAIKERSLVANIKISKLSVHADFFCSSIHKKNKTNSEIKFPLKKNIKNDKKLYKLALFQ